MVTSEQQIIMLKIKDNLLIDTDGRSRRLWLYRSWASYNKCVTLKKCQNHLSLFLFTLPKIIIPLSSFYFYCISYLYKKKRCYSNNSPYAKLRVWVSIALNRCKGKCKTYIYMVAFKFIYGFCPKSSSPFIENTRKITPFYRIKCL